MNPSCPNCGNIMSKQAMNTVVGTEMKGRSDFWRCKACKIRFKVGYESIRPKIASENLVFSNKQVITTTGRV